MGVFEPDRQVPFTPYVRKKGPERPAFISPKEAVAVFQQMGGRDAMRIMAYGDFCDKLTYGDFVDKLKSAGEGKELTSRLGLLDLMRDPDKGTHDLYFLLSVE